jgi:Tol biopolymer transport system component
LVFLTGGVQIRQLAWFDRTGKQLGDPVGAAGEYNDIVLSRDGKRLAMQRLTGEQSDVWLMDLARAGALSRFTFSPNTEDNPIWSPDGNYVAFSLGGGTSTNIYRKVSSGAGNEEMLVQSEVTKEPTDWSSDGRFIIFSDYRPKTGSDLWVLPFFGDGKPYKLLETEFEEGQGHFSPDGRWFAYTSNESGRDEVYVQSFPVTGGKWLISTGGGSQPQWCCDGKEIFYVASDKTLMSVEINAGALFESSVPKRLFVTQVSAYNSPNRYAVSADGQRFLVNGPSGDGHAAPITVVLNWTSGLKK